MGASSSCYKNGSTAAFDLAADRPTTLLQPAARVACLRDVSASPITVGTLLLDGTEDPVEVMRRGGVEVSVDVRRDVKKVVRSFRESSLPHVVDTGIALPTLYLHLLDRDFFPDQGDINIALRSGNDNSEIILSLPMDMEISGLDAQTNASLSTVFAFLRSQGEVQISSPEPCAGGFGPARNWKTTMNVTRLYYRLKTSRPKCAVTLDKKLFGIPDKADLFLFAENHMSISYMSDRTHKAFDTCISELPKVKGAAAKFAVFLKVFYEGGFAYNEKVSTSASSYLPKNVGVGSLGITPAFEGQGGIATGYPYLMKAHFFPFIDTVPVSIKAISEMSQRHGRYGLCFTRCVFLWDGGALESEGKLDFCAPAPHGGFFYAPSDPVQYHELGGLLYAFGEARETLENAVCAASNGATSSSSQAAREADRRACVICLSSDATMATVPCGHLAFCAECGPDAETRRLACPVCRASVQSVIRIF